MPPLLRVGILGSGFGLYGYLPAISAFPQCKVALPMRYRPKLEARSDISAYTANVEWQEDECTVIQSVNALVCARRPSDNEKLVNTFLKSHNATHLLIEKPMAASANSAIAVNSLVGDSQIKYRIGYTFRYTTWAKILLQEVRNFREFSINWRFMAHHYRNNLNVWKRYTSCGGGAINFYGIHIIAILTEIGYNRVLNSTVSSQTEDEDERWAAIFAGPNLPVCKVNIDTFSKEEYFEVSSEISDGGKKILIRQQNPFSYELECGNHILDRRIYFLQMLWRELLFSKNRDESWYNSVNQLWKEITESTLR